MNKTQHYSSFTLGVILPFLALLVYSSSFLPFIADDALISFRYVQRLISGEGLTWTPGLAVEGYSNLSWVLALSIFSVFDLDLIWSSRFLAALLYFSILWMNYLYWRPFFNANNQTLFYIGQYAYAFSATTAIWLVGGLEQPLVAASLAWAVYFLLKDQQSFERQQHIVSSSLMYASLALGVLCLTRPDSPIICVCLAFAIVLHNGLTTKQFFRCCVLAIFPVIFVLGQLLFRLHYYGEWVAMPALIKVHPNLSSVKLGLLYIAAGLLFLGPFSYYCFRLLFCGVHTQQRFLYLLVFTTTIIWLIYLTVIGGDIFPAFRHFTQISVLLTLLFPAIEKLTQQQSKNSKLFSPPWLIAMSIIYIIVQWANPSTSIARGHLWVWDGEVIANAMKQGFSNKKPLIAVDAAGALPYWTEYPALDMLGLNDSHIAHSKPSQKSQFLGHQFGDGHYVYQRQPDIINFAFAHGIFEPFYKSGKELWEMDKFHQNYIPVRLSGTSPYFIEGVQWLYKWSDKVGITQSQQQLSIPAYFFSLQADFDNRTVNSKNIQRVHDFPIPNHLIRSYIGENNEWQINIEKGQTIYLSQPSHTIIEIAKTKVVFIPNSANISIEWQYNSQGQQVLALTSEQDSSQVLESIILMTTD